MAERKSKFATKYSENKITLSIGKDLIDLVRVAAEQEMTSQTNYIRNLVIADLKRRKLLVIEEPSPKSLPRPKHRKISRNAAVVGHVRL